MDCVTFDHTFHWFPKQCRERRSGNKRVIHTPSYTKTHRKNFWTKLRCFSCLCLCLCGIVKKHFFLSFFSFNLVGHFYFFEYTQCSVNYVFDGVLCVCTSIKRARSVCVCLKIVWINVYKAKYHLPNTRAVYLALLELTHT